MRPGAATLLLTWFTLFLGVGLIARTVALGGGAAAVGVVVGVLLVAAGAGRLYVERQRR